MADSYVTSQATLKCSFGESTCKLTVYPDRTVFLNNKPMGNISDHISMYNIHPFGKCHTTSYPPTGSATAANHGCLTPMPCVPGTNSNWINGKNDYIIKGNPALLKSSFCKCCYGGIITIISDGQVNTGKPDDSKEDRETEEDWLSADNECDKSDDEVELTSDECNTLEGIQMALDAAGFIPGWGAFADLINAGIYACRGDFASAGFSLLSAVPLIGDLAAASKIINRGVKLTKTVGTVGKRGVTVGKGEVRLLKRNVPRQKANKVFTDNGKESPFGSDIIKVKLTEDKSFVRVSTSDNVKGRWVMEESEIKGLSPKEIKEKFALPKEPDRVYKLTIKKGTIMRKSKVGGNDFGEGGGAQYYLQNNSFEKVDFDSAKMSKY